MERALERKYGVDPALAGRMAECDGGGAVEVARGVVLAGREFYRGRLTGVFFETGAPPSRWYEMTALEVAPEGYAEDSVWCEVGFLFVCDD